ncbi:hypothetical protein ES288_A05G351100v1 [Gossypium darwinii]|uniref:S-protein homolog n=1 Tax=Gossypium darwinii TaxID=34276 RepID=A0A5D2GN02_GOSDA|nr:hypothetical protein ES288_A05G351100v1 [Gossypium darwinii]
MACEFGFSHLIELDFLVVINKLNNGMGLFEPKVHVLIYNDLQNWTDLTNHCKSKNDDLSVHLLTYRNHYEFKFCPSILLDTWPEGTCLVEYKKVTCYSWNANA